MVALPFGVIWGGYLLTVWGWCLVRGYDVTLWELAKPVKVYQWPVPPKQPDLIPASQVWPSAASAKTAAKAHKAGAGGQPV